MKRNAFVIKILTLCLCLVGMLVLPALAEEKLTVEVVRENGVSTLKINGKTQVPELIYHTLLTKWRTFPNVLGKGINPSVELVKLAEKHGFHLTTVVMPLCWPKDGKPADYAALDKIMDKHIELDPKVLTLPRLIGKPPSWWMKQNPDEGLKCQVAPGRGELPARRLREVTPYATPTSPKWRQDYYHALRLQVRYLEKKYGNHIFGYHPGIQSCGENFYPLAWDARNPCMMGFSESFRQGFAKYAERKYKTLDKLNQAWKTELKSFSEIRVPTMEERIEGHCGPFRDPQTQRFVIDFMTYFQHPIAEVSMDTARIVKEETGGRKLVVFFYGSPQSGHSPLNPGQRGVLELGEILDCPDIDIICNPYDYRNRQHGGIGIVGNMLDSINQRGKMYFVEDDTRSHTAPFNHFGKTKTMQESKEVFLRLFPQLLQYNLGRWYMDFGSGYNAQPELFELFEKMRLARERFPVTPYRPEIAMVSDTESSLYLRGSNKVSIHFFDMTRDYPLIGAPFGRYLLKDVCAGNVPKETKVLFFFNAYKFSPEQRQQLHQSLAKNGQTAVWFYAPGYLDGEQANVENIRKTTGIGVEKIPTPMRAKFALTQALSSLPEGESFGVNKVMETMFAITKDQPNVRYLANYSEGNYTGLASKQMDGWKSVLFCGPRFGPAIFRALAQDSGAHIYCDSNDSISGSSNFIAINAISTGTKTLHFPRKVDLSDIFTGETIATGVTRHTLDMKKGETKTFLKK